MGEEETKPMAQKQNRLVEIMRRIFKKKENEKEKKRKENSHNLSKF